MSDFTFFPEASDKKYSKPNKGLVVDAFCAGNPGFGGYRIIDLETGEFVVKVEPKVKTTNNVLEFLGLCHAIKYAFDNKRWVPIYSDSVTALSWVKNRVANSSDKNSDVAQALKNACDFLRGHQYDSINKWETALWGENPADYGRK